MGFKGSRVQIPASRPLIPKDLAAVSSGFRFSGSPRTHSLLLDGRSPSFRSSR